jgi:hypothetical protein
MTTSSATIKLVVRTAAVVRIWSLYAVTEVSKVSMHPSKGVPVAQVMPLDFLLVVMKRYIPFVSSSARDLPTGILRRRTWSNTKLPTSDYPLAQMIQASTLLL